MASQPLNTAIKVFRTLRSQRSGVRHESVKALTGGLRSLDLQVPGLETPDVYALTRDTNTKGITTYDETGRPIVIGIRAVKDFSVIETLTGVDIPVVIGQDKFIQNTTAGLATVAAGADLQKQARDAS